MWLHCCFGAGSAGAAEESLKVAAADGPASGPAQCEGVRGSTASLPSSASGSPGTNAHVVDAAFKRLSAGLDGVSRPAAEDEVTSSKPRQALGPSITDAVLQHAHGDEASGAHATSQQLQAMEAAMRSKPLFTQHESPTAGPGPSPSHHSAASQPPPVTQLLSPPSRSQLPRSTSQNGTQHGSTFPHSRSPSQAGTHGLGPHLPGHLSSYNSASVSRMQSLLFGPGHGGGETSPHSCNGSVMSSDTWGNLSAVSGNLSVLSDPRHTSMASDVLAKFLADVNQYDNPGTVHLLQQDLRNLTMIGRGGCGVVYQAEWRGAHVAVKLVVSDDTAKLQDSVMEAITGRFLAHPQVVHTYAAVLVPVDHALMLLDPNYQPEHEGLDADHISEMEVQQLLVGSEEADALWDEIDNERPSRMMAGTAGEVRLAAATAAAQLASGAAERDGEDGGQAAAAGPVALDPLHEMWLAQQLVDRRADAISAIPLMPGTSPSGPPCPDQPLQQRQAQGLEQGQGQNMGHPEPSASWVRTQRDAALLAWQGPVAQRWPPSPVKEEPGSPEGPPGSQAKSMRWPPEQHDSAPSSPTDPYYSSLPAGFTVSAVVRQAVAAGSQPAGPGMPAPGSPGKHRSSLDSATAALAVAGDQQQQRGSEPGVRTPPGSPTAPSPPSPPHLAALLRQTSIPKGSPSRLQRSVTAAEAAAEDEVRRSGGSPAAAADASQAAAASAAAAAAAAAAGPMLATWRSSSPTRTTPTSMTHIAQPSSQVTEDRHSIGVSNSDSNGVSSSRAANRMLFTEGIQLVLAPGQSDTGVARSPAPSGIHSCATDRDGVAATSATTATAATAAQAAVALPTTVATASAAPAAAVASTTAEEGLNSVVEDGQEGLPALPALRTRRSTEPSLSNQTLMQMLATSGSNSDISLAGMVLGTAGGSRPSSGVSGAHGGSRPHSGALRPMSNSSRRSSSRPGSLKATLGLVDDRAPSFRTVLSFAQPDACSANCITGLVLTLHGSQDGCTDLAPKTADQDLTGDLVAVPSSERLSDGLPAQLRPTISGEGGSDICLSPKPATPVAEGEGCSTPRALTARSGSSYPGGSTEQQQEGVTLQTHRVLSLPHFSGPGTGTSSSGAEGQLFTQSHPSYRRTDGTVPVLAHSDAAAVAGPASVASSAWGEVWASARTLASSGPHSGKASSGLLSLPAGSSGPSFLQQQAQQQGQHHVPQQAALSPWYPPAGSSGPSFLQQQGQAQGLPVPYPLEILNSRGEQSSRVSPPTPSHGRTSSSAGSAATTPFSPTPGGEPGMLEPGSGTQARRKLLTQRSDASQLAQFFDPSAPTSPSHGGQAAQGGAGSMGEAAQGGAGSVGGAAGAGVALIRSSSNTSRGFTRWDSSATAPFSGAGDALELVGVAQLSDEAMPLSDQRNSDLAIKTSSDLAMKQSSDLAMKQSSEMHLSDSHRPQRFSPSAQPSAQHGIQLGLQQEVQQGAEVPSPARRLPMQQLVPQVADQQVSLRQLLPKAADQQVSIRQQIPQAAQQQVSLQAAAAAAARTRPGVTPQLGGGKVRSRTAAVLPIAPPPPPPQDQEQQQQQDSALEASVEDWRLGSTSSPASVASPAAGAAQAAATTGLSLVPADTGALQQQQAPQQSPQQEQQQQVAQQGAQREGEGHEQEHPLRRGRVSPVPSRPFVPLPHLAPIPDYEASASAPLLSQLPTSFHNQPLGQMAPSRGTRPSSKNSNSQLRAAPGDVPVGNELKRRNSAGSVDFSFGNSFSGKHSFMFSEALRLLNLKQGQFVTCLVMEYCDRGSLAGAIKRGLFQPSERWGRGTALRALIRTAKEVAQGLSYLHSVNITHGDLKPGNVLLKSSRLDRRGFTVRLADFGFCKIGGEGEEDMRGMSTLAYSAPETLDGQRGPASDVWSFGVLLYEMVVGQQPLLELHWGALLASLAAGDVAGYFEWPPTAHPVLRRLGVACMSIDPAKRPSAHVISKVMVKLEDSLKHPSGPHGGAPITFGQVHRGSTPLLGGAAHSAHLPRSQLQHRLSHTGAAGAPTSAQLPPRSATTQEQAGGPPQVARASMPHFV